MMTEIELHLVGAAAPNGEIAAKDVAALAAALQELATRVGREMINTPGPGRSKQFMEEFAQLRLRAVESGSTVLRFNKGPVDKLAVELPEEALADDRLWEIAGAIGDDRRPEWVTDLIAESAGKLVSAVRAAAPTVILKAQSRIDVHIRSAATHSETWVSPSVRTGGVATAAGRLEKVDLRSHAFRLRDDVDNTVELRNVESDTLAARLVGQWVIAEGTAILHASGRLVALESARVLPAEDPAAEFLGSRVVAPEEILASAPGPDFDGGIDLTDEEFEAFLRAARS